MECCRDGDDVDDALYAMWGKLNAEIISFPSAYIILFKCAEIYIEINMLIRDLIHI